MANQKILLQPGYVLHTRAYRDSSALVELMTPEYGRVCVIARGVKSAKSRWRGILQPFQPLLVSWNKRGELGTLTASESRGPALTIPADIISSGLYLNEILMRLLERDEGHIELFGAYDETLRGMASLAPQADTRNVELEILLRQFEVQLLTALGYGLVLDQEVNTETPLQSQHDYIYQLERGPVKLENNATISFHKFKDASEHGTRISGQTLLAIQAGDFSDENVRLESKRLLRGVLSYYLGAKPLYSRNLAQPLNRH